MEILDLLAQEHRVLEDLLRRIERAMKYPREVACKEWQKAFLVLLPALDRHEEIETIAFENPAYQSKKGARRILREIELQHGKISSLRQETLAALKEVDVPDLPSLHALISQLVRRLRDHFVAEETSLWPHYRAAMRGALDKSVKDEIQEKLRRIKKDAGMTQAAAADYLG